MAEKVIWRVEFTGIRALLVIALLLLSLTGYMLFVFMAATSSMEEMRDILRVRVVAEKTAPLVKEIQSLVEKETLTSDDRERLTTLAELSGIQVTSLNMRGLFLGEMVFRVTYRTGHQTATEQNAFFIATYHPMLGWRLSEIYSCPEFFWNWAPLRRIRTQEQKG